MLNKQEVGFWKAVWPLAFFFAAIIYGLFIQPVFLKEGMLPFEVLILMAMTFCGIYLIYHGYTWKTIQHHMTQKVGESIGVIMILFCIGVLIGSWIVSGTIPMLLYYGLQVISPDWIYLFAFLICILFSLLTGTSWGSAGTIGIVLMGIAEAYGANTFITAGAIVGGSFFGDKMSPLSDTTNVASLATDVPLFDHIRSMAYTTGPSAIIAAIIYAGLSPYFSGPLASTSQPESIQATLTGLQDMFEFNPLLLLPLAVVVWGSVTKKPIILTLLGSSWLAMILALILQPFSLSNIIESLSSGFSVSMAEGVDPDSKVLNILNRGGLYSLINGITTCFLIFAFIGMLNVIDAIDVVIRNVMEKIKTKRQLVVAALTSTALTNLTTSNQYATSFVIGTAFKDKFDELGVNKKVLSRSIEDAGTMLENLAPWTPSGLFMLGALGVSSVEYAPYQFMSLINLAVAYFFAVTGIACFYKEGSSRE